MDIEVKLPGREQINLSVSVDAQGVISKATLTGVGGPELLELLELWRPQLSGKLGDVCLPEGNAPASILLRELILKARGEWKFPYAEIELCHCRAVPTELVDMAVITGAHSADDVSLQTSASTACGTCRPDVEAIIHYRLSK